MNPIGSNSFAAQIYNGIQGRLGLDRQAQSRQNSAQGAVEEQVSEFTLPMNATPRGDWVLSESANPQNFDPASPRGSYLNVVV